MLDLSHNKYHVYLERVHKGHTSDCELGAGSTKIAKGSMERPNIGKWSKEQEKLSEIKRKTGSRER